MVQVLNNAWALLLGILLLMVGNGLLGSLIGIRGAIEDFSTAELSVITSAYFVGFLFGSRATPELIRRVGHVRVFAALGSFVSAVLIMYPAVTEPWAWILFRVVFGFCFSGVYVTAESWLNNAATNETRGQALSLYIIVQMAGVVASQALLNVADPAGYILFVIPSVLVSLSFAPILLTASRSPSFEATKAMGLADLYNSSPTGMVGMFAVGMTFGALFGMASIYGTQAGFSIAQISGFVSAIFVGGLVFQYPIGWLSDRMDRRVLVLWSAVAGVAGAMIGAAYADSFEVALAVGFVMGGVSNPLYALLIAYTNDYLELDDMAAASGGLLFVNGLGAVAGPMIVGWMLTQFGPAGYWAHLVFVMAALAAYTLYRMTQRASAFVEEDDYDAVSYAPVSPYSTAVAVEVAQEVYVENAEELEEADPSEEEEQNG